METTLLHTKRLAGIYKGSKGRKVCWTEDYSNLETFIPKFRPTDLPVATPRNSKYHDQIRDYQKRIQDGEHVIEIPSDNPAKLRGQLSKSAKQIAPELKFITNTKEGKVVVISRKEDGIKR